MIGGKIMSSVFEKIAHHKIVPVVKLDCADDALPLAEALCAGGLPVAEVTFRTDAAEESIARIAKAMPDVVLGAGTVTNVEQARRAVGAGATYIVTPGFSHPVAEYCAKNNISATLGVCTPTEIVSLIEYGFDIAKFFPAAQFGGLATIKALSGPFPGIKYIPTGGVSAANIAEYLSFSKVIACGGSWMVKADMIQSGDFETITKLTKTAVDIVANI
jgi:2-dehydro-3-deoxyphosphogluconate aldolase/(4S)-4-hydroxy-2-oxoglutarate aldolase